MRNLLFIAALSIFSASYAEEVIWSGNVNSDGTPTEAVKLELNKKYQLRVSGFVNLGKWVQNKERLANDACYEFSPEKGLEKTESFQNSLEISVCDEKYHSDHVYQSERFVAKNNRIHFWIYDDDYDDNHGELKVEVLKIAD